jgi:hypothetical protein
MDTKLSNYMVIRLAKVLKIKTKDLIITKEMLENAEELPPPRHTISIHCSCFVLQLKPTYALIHKGFREGKAIKILKKMLQF